VGPVGMKSVDVFCRRFCIPFIYHGSLYTMVVYIPWSLFAMEFVYHDSGSLYTMVVYIPW
jgi:hypothetical protein